ADAARLPAENGPLRSPRSVARAPAGSRGRVLVADDNPANQRVAVWMLEDLGFRADAVANGMEALDVLRRIPYDAVLLDCHMPEMDGFATVIEIRRRERESGAAPLPVIAITADALQSDRQRCIAAGMNDFIVKPVRLNDLATTLDRWLPRVEPERAATPATSAADGDRRERFDLEQALARVHGDASILRE